MKTTKQTAVNSTLGGGSYKSPEIAVSEIFNEGVLCSSTQLQENEEWGENTLNW